MNMIAHLIAELVSTVIALFAVAWVLQATGNLPPKAMLMPIYESGKADQLR